ncbi:MAG TPA: hypothetical protein VF470_05730 [Sphingomicrobium sp.]
MLPLLLAAIAANAPDVRITSAQPAQATVTIVRGAEIRFGKAMRFEESTVRTALVRERNGSTLSASLIEFY